MSKLLTSTASIATREMSEFDREYFSDWSRDCLRILRFMTKKWPKKKLFYTDELSPVINLKGRALGGVLGSFSKNNDLPLVIKHGTVATGWRGEKLSRPKQLWGLHYKLTNWQISQVRESLKHFRLDERL